MNLWDDKMFYEALLFATKAHDGQKMKHPIDVPYAAHIFGVFGNAIKYATNEKNVDWNLLACAALLHDTIEDTAVTYEQICEKFGKAVADGVLALSKNKKMGKDAMMDSVARIKMQPKEVAIVKMADRLFNMQCRVPAWTEEKQEKYKQEAIYIAQNLGFACKPLKRALFETIERY